MILYPFEQQHGTINTVIQLMSAFRENTGISANTCLVLSAGSKHYCVLERPDAASIPMAGNGILSRKEMYRIGIDGRRDLYTVKCMM